MGVQVPNSRYSFDLVDTDVIVKQTDEITLPDITAALETVSQIGGRIDRPGCRIRVKDGNGSVVFVGIITDQGTSKQAEVPFNLGTTPMKSNGLFPPDLLRTPRPIAARKSRPAN